MPKAPTCLCGECQTCKHRLYMRDYLRRNPDKNATNLAKWRSKPENKARMNANAREFRRRTPRAVKYAQDRVAKALRRGQLQRPDLCDLCDVKCKPIAHHHDYSKPLDVLWLCRSCHAFEHSPYPKGQT